MDLSHEKIIRFIDEHHRNQISKFFSARFAIWEVANATGCNPRSISRVLDMLRNMKLVGKMPRAYKHKYWEVTGRWTNAEDVIGKYEIAYIMKSEI